MTFSRLFIFVLGLFAAFTFASYEHADAKDLKEAMAQAYETNPEINAARAQLRAINEGVPQAKSGYRPTVSGSADVGRSWNDSPIGDSITNPRGYSVTVSQPIFRGLRTKNSISAAEARVLAGRQDLANTEQNVLFAAVSAYMDVMSTRAIVGLRQRDLDALAEQLRGTQARFNVGEVTRTDVAQSQARLALSQSQLTAAIADSMTAEANFVRVVGV